MAKPHLGAIYVKDFVWNGRRPHNVALGEGQVNPSFFKILKQSDYRGPVSVHVEYLENDGTDANVKALRNDLQKVKALLA